MDEILIDEKRYVSSKRAAEITGYAKDYVGQLCREGRVPARLVGRGWYVLESAIRDHRFGTPIVPEEKKEEPESVLPPTWQAARYEAAPVEEIPFINRLEKQEPRAEEEGFFEKEGEEAHQSLHESWREWFAQKMEAAPEEVLPPEEEAVQEEEETSSKEEDQKPIESEDIKVPIRAIYHPVRGDLPERMLSRSSEMARVKTSTPEVDEEVQRPRAKSRGRLIPIFTNSLSMLVAGAAIISAIVSSGYFDSYAISHNQVHFVAGISLYNK